MPTNDMARCMEPLYIRAHEMFMYQVIESVEAIHDAAAKALSLKDRAIKLGAQGQHGGATLATEVTSAQQQELAGTRHRGSGVSCYMS